MHECQIDMLYPLSWHNVMCEIYFNKKRGKKENISPNYTYSDLMKTILE